MKRTIQVHVRKPEPRFQIESPLVVGTPYLIDMFEIKSDMIYNCMCDSFKAAKTLIFPDLDAAKKQMFGKLRPIPGLQAFAGTADAGLWFLAVKGKDPKGKGGTEALEKRSSQVLGLLDEDGSSGLKMLAARVKEHASVLKAANEEAAGLRKEWEDAREAEARCKADEKKAEKLVRELRRQLKELEEEGQQDAAQDRLNELLHHMRELVHRRREAEELEEQTLKQHRKLDAELQPKRDKALELQARACRRAPRLRCRSRNHHPERGGSSLPSIWPSAPTSSYPPSLLHGAPFSPPPLAPSLQNRFNVMNETTQAKMKEVEELKGPERKALLAANKLDKVAAQAGAECKAHMKEVTRMQGDSPSARLACERGPLSPSLGPGHMRTVVTHTPVCSMLALLQTWEWSPLIARR